MQDIRSSSAGHGSLREVFHYRDLLRNLIAKDIKVRYQGAALGFIWSLANPLALIALYSFIFSHVFRSAQANYTLFLIAGLLHWNLFSQIIAQSGDFLIGNAGLLKKIYFPRIIIPTAGVLFNLVLWLLAIAVFFVIFPFMGGRFTPVMLTYPVFLLAFIVFTWGAALAIAVLNVEFRDLRHIVEVALMFLFWLTPIVYEFSMIPAHLRQLFALSPLVDFVLIFQSLLYSGQLPTPHLVIAAGLWTVASAAVGYWLFHRKINRLIEKL